MWKELGENTLLLGTRNPNLLSACRRWEEIGKQRVHAENVIKQHRLDQKRIRVKKALTLKQVARSSMVMHLDMTGVVMRTTTRRVWAKEAGAARGIVVRAKAKARAPFVN